jgi:phospholipid/cholesterol/gamma-HCH transport system substrate-binding protein
MNRTRLSRVVAVALTGLIIAAGGLVIRNAYFRPTTITAYFTSATGIYRGDDVRVAGVKVGTITNIEPAGGQVRVTLGVDRDVPVPADAKAVIVAQNLLSARYVGLAPAYESSGPVLPDGAVIPVDRTAIPVEWDQVEAQLTRLATELGPKNGAPGSSVAGFIDSAANAMAGNGDKLRRTLAELSGVGRILADNGGNVVDILKNLQTFVSALRDSTTQIVQFEDRFATLTSVLDDSKSTLDAALTDLSVAVGDVQRFVAGTRDQAAEQVQRLSNVTQNLVEHKTDLENVLHVAPNALANQSNIYNPDNGAPLGAFVTNNFANPVAFICSAIGGIENVTAAETAKLCSAYLGPGLAVANPFTLANINYLPIPLNPFLMKSTSPDKIIYTEPRLAPGGAGPKPGPPETPPAVSAYTGAVGDATGPRSLPELLLPSAFGAPAVPPGSAPNGDGGPPR